jgi:hypothetical protein
MQSLIRTFMARPSLFTLPRSPVFVRVRKLHAQSTENQPGPLAGVKILDLSRVLAVSLHRLFERVSLTASGPILYSNTSRLWRRRDQG